MLHRIHHIAARVRSCVLALLLGSAVFAADAAAQQWVTPPVSAPRVRQFIFQSASVGAEVSYHVYLPAAYHADPGRRFPVLYWLHGSNSATAGISQVSAWFDAAISAGRIRPMIVVFPNGLPFGMWCNWANGTAPVEDMVIQDLLPEIDARFRTITEPRGRIIEGFSMGGYGAGRLGFTYNQLFGGISLLGGGPLQLDFLNEPPGSAVPLELRLMIYERVYASDPDLFLARSPWLLAEQHRAELLASGIPIRQLIGQLDFTLPANLEFHQRLIDLAIPHVFFNPPGVAHDALGLFNAIGEANWPFYHAVFGPPRGACPADFNHDGFVDFFDFDDFASAFARGLSSADFNADGFIDFFDFDDFTAAFDAGC
jgi:hypothetical protein